MTQPHTALHQPRTAHALARLNLDPAQYAQVPPTTTLTERDRANLLIARVGTLCKMSYVARLTEEAQATIDEAFATGRVPPENLLRRAHPHPYRWLDDQGLALTRTNVLQYFNLTHKDDETPWLKVRVIARTRKDKLCWTVRTTDKSKLCLRVLNPFGLDVSLDEQAYIHATRNQHGTPASGIIVTRV